jgi:hypothetical protein
MHRSVNLRRATVDADVPADGPPLEIEFRSSGLWTQPGKLVVISATIT